VKLDWNRPEKLVALKANMVCQIARILCYCYVEDICYSFCQQYHPQTLHRLDHVWNDIVNTQSIYDNEEFFSVFHVTRSTFTEIVTHVKNNHVLQGENIDKQSKHFVLEIHLLVTLNFFGAEDNQKGSK
jgi:hypothetical protein